MRPNTVVSIKLQIDVLMWIIKTRDEVNFRCDVLTGFRYRKLILLRAAIAYIIKLLNYQFMVTTQLAIGTHMEYFKGKLES
jgi:hypothetical protein